MSAVIDLVLIGILVLSAVRHYKLGLVCSIFNAGKLIVAIILASVLGKHAAVAVSAMFFKEAENSAAANALSGIIGYAVIFVAVLVASGFFIRVLSKIKIPILTKLDKLLGLVLGLIIGVFAVSLLSTIIYSVIEFLGAVNPNNEAISVYEKSYFFKFVYDLKIFEYVRQFL